MWSERCTTQEYGDICALSIWSHLSFLVFQNWWGGGVNMRQIHRQVAFLSSIFVLSSGCAGPLHYHLVLRLQLPGNRAANWWMFLFHLFSPPAPHPPTPPFFFFTWHNILQDSIGKRSIKQYNQWAGIIVFHAAGVLASVKTNEMQNISSLKFS